MKDKTRKILSTIGLIMMLTSLFILGNFSGWFLNDLVEEYNVPRTYNGLWTKADTKPDALETAKEYDGSGDWVCVNIKGMSFEQGFKTCKHEVGHEIWAEFCENNIERCINATR